MSIPATVVPAYPYEGAIYWLISETTVRHGHSHPYYATLYGTEPDKVLPRAGALVSLFDRIELASADHALPDQHTYFSGDQYYHPDLRLSVSQRYEDNEWTDEATRLTEFCLQTKLLDSTFGQHSFFKGNQFHQRHFISRLLQQVRLAIKLNALIVGDTFFHTVYKIISPYIKQFIDDSPGPLPDGLILNLDERTLAITGLEFAPASFDAFAAIRTSKDISTYSSEFRNAIGIALSSNDLDKTLLGLMRKALDSQEVTKHVTNAIQTTGSVLNFIGLIPVAGSVASLGCIGADAAGRATESLRRHHNWYLLGSEIKSISLKQLLLKS